jgi:hypothetical protein
MILLLFGVTDGNVLKFGEGAQREEVKAAKANRTVVPLANVPRQHALACVLGRCLSKLARAGNVAAADIEPVADKAPFRDHAHHHASGQLPEKFSSAVSIVNFRSPSRVTGIVMSTGDAQRSQPVEMCQRTKPLAHLSATAGTFFAITRLIRARHR